MQWNFEDSRSDRLLMGSAYDIALFFIAVVLVFVVAVMPVSSLASGAAPGEQTFLSSLYLSGPLALLWFGIFMHRRRRALVQSQLNAVPEELTAFYSLANGFVVVFVGGWLGYTALNAHLDWGDEQIHYSYVVDKQISDDGRYEAYKLTLSDWNKEGGTLVMDVTSDLYDQIDSEESCLRLITRPGAFGHEWVVESHPFLRSDVKANPDWKYQCKAAWAGHAQMVETATKSTDY